VVQKYFDDNQHRL